MLLNRNQNRLEFSPTTWAVLGHLTQNKFQATFCESQSAFTVEIIVKFFAACSIEMFANVTCQFMTRLTTLSMVVLGTGTELL